MLDRRHVGAETAGGVASAVGHAHFAADHLPHHGGGAPRDVGRMGDDDDRDSVGHGFVDSRKVSQTACTSRQLELAPGSRCPMLRSRR